MKTRPLLLGHRGARVEESIPENTLASFDLALASGCDGFEFDVRLSADGQPVICHDATVTTKSRRLEISKCRAQDLGTPLLRDVLERYHRTAFLDIELKVAGLETITAALLKDCAPSPGFVVSSFLPGVLKDLHEIDSTIPLGLIGERRNELSRWEDLPVDYVIPHYKLVGDELLTSAKSAGKKILVWTVNIPAAMRRFWHWGADGIISDDPGLLALTLRGKSESELRSP